MKSMCISLGAESVIATITSSMTIIVTGLIHDMAQDNRLYHHCAGAMLQPVFFVAIHPNGLN
jgi:hypothetical protein